MQNNTHSYTRLSLTTTLAVSVLETFRHLYRLGWPAALLGLILIGLPILAVIWFRKSGRPVALFGYGLISGWIILGFGFIDGGWDGAAKLFLGNFLLARYGQYFSWQPVGDFPLEATGVLSLIASIFAAYYLIRLHHSAMAELRIHRKAWSVVWVPVTTTIILSLAFLQFTSQRTISAGTTVPEDGVVRIGVLIPAGGPTAVIGESFLKAIEVAKEDIAAKDTKHRYELVVARSSTSNPLQTKAAIQKLISVDRVNAVIGGISASGKIIKPYITHAQIPHICVCSILDIGDGEYNFTLIGTPEDDAELWTTEAERRGIKTIALLTMEHDSINGHVAAVKSAADKKGMDVVYETKYEITTTDFSDRIQAARAASPDVYFIEAANPALDVLRQQMWDAGIHNISSFVAPSFSAKPELFEGTWYVDTNLVDEGFRERFEARYPDTHFATHMMPFAFDALNILVQGFESPEGVTSHIQALTEYPSAAGTVTKMPGSGNFQPYPAIWVIADGKPVLLSKIEAQQKRKEAT
ncbi:MAG: hypothetical protein AMXMBFR84_00060 [Candidatus Hydrogenedentota bacterium]